MFSDEISFPPTHIISIFYSKANIFRTLPGMLMQKDCWLLLLVPCMLQPRSESCCVCVLHTKARYSVELYAIPRSHLLFIAILPWKKHIYTSQSSSVLLKGWRVMCGLFKLTSS